MRKLISSLVIIGMLFSGCGKKRTAEEEKIYKETDMCYTIAYSRTKNNLRYPSTFDVVGISNKNIGKGVYTSELKYTAKNPMGFAVPYVAIYKCDFPADKVSLIKSTTR